MKKYIFALAIVWITFVPLVGQATCKESSDMVHSFALMRDNHMPLVEVHKHIDSLNNIAGPPGGLTREEIPRYYKQLHVLADVTYSMKDQTPDQLQASFYVFCKSPKENE